MSGFNLESKSSIPDFLRIPIPPFGAEIPGISPIDPEMVEIRRDSSFDSPNTTARTSLPEDVPFEIPRSLVRDIKRDIPYGVCRAVCQSQQIVIKFALGGRGRWFDALKREANNYKTHLSTVQGSVVPYLYGYYTGMTCDDSDMDSDAVPISCLIMEDCGDRLMQPFRKLPVEERAEIMRQYCELHMLGVSPNDFAERNVVCKNGRYRLIDFHDIEDIKEFHECHWKGELGEGGPNPGSGGIGCPYIHNTGMDLSLWGCREGRVRVFNRVMKGDDYPSQEEIDVLCNNEHFAVSPLMVDVLLEWLRNYKRVKSQVSLEEYTLTRPDLSSKAFVGSPSPQMASNQSSKSSIPSLLKISLPALGIETPGFPFEEVVEVRRDSSFDSDTFAPTLSSLDAPYEIPRPSVKGIKRGIPYGVCRVVCQSRQLVVKFALGGKGRWYDALKREANNYKTYLSTVQGSVVPYLCGFYTGVTCDDRELPVSCMILEDCGEQLSQPFRELPIEDRAKIMRQYCELHSLGISLNDFAERNVVRKDGHFRLIDFHDIEDIKDDHECHWIGVLLEGAPNPGTLKIGCPYIYEVGMSLSLWGYPEGRVRVLSRLIKADGYPSQEDIDALCNNEDFQVSPLMVNKLLEWLRNYEKVKNQTSLALYSKTRPDVSFTAHPQRNNV